MIYTDIREAVFLNRPNRFIANMEIDGGLASCHVKNTGRCQELLLPGAAIWVQEVRASGRKTQYDLINVLKGQRIINIDSAAPNKVFSEWVRSGGLFQGITLLKAEQRFGNSRFDFYAESGKRRAFIEVKGVTLESGGVAMFPDAPTARGLKHVHELIACADAGYEAYIVFIIQMKGLCRLEPNWHTHPEFGEALLLAIHSGVHVLALDCHVTANSIVAADPVPVHMTAGMHRK